MFGLIFLALVLSCLLPAVLLLLVELDKARVQTLRDIPKAKPVMPMPIGFSRREVNRMLRQMEKTQHAKNALSRKKWRVMF